MSEPATPLTDKRCVCGSDAIEPQLLKPSNPGYGTHHSKLICCDCGKFNGWGRDPRMTAARDQRVAEIRRVLTLEALPAWERGFIQGIAQARHLTPKQEAVWLKILSRYPDDQPR